MKAAPETVAYADSENRKLIVEFAIPGAPADTVDVKTLEYSVHLAAPARDIEYVASPALGWPVKSDKAEATYGTVRSYAWRLKLEKKKGEARSLA
jgi:HSP20 family molecular chaperone IbpA